MLLLRIRLSMVLYSNNMPQNLNDNEWELVDSIANVLEPLKEATNIMSGEMYPTLSHYIPLYMELINVVRGESVQNERIRDIRTYLSEALKVI